MSFADLGLSAPLLHAVHLAGYEQATPIQAGAIPFLLAGRDLLGSAQTGTGKTAAFALPILHRLMEHNSAQNSTGQGNSGHTSAGKGGVGKDPRFARKPRLRALILSPTRELASQIAESFETYGAGVPLKQAVIFGGVGYNPQIRALRQGIDILVATPGRLLDLMNQGAVRFDDIQMFVLDEADRMLDMGFMPDLQRIMAALPKQRQNILFSATFPAAIADLANDLLENPAEVRIQPESKTADLIEQGVCFSPRMQKLRVLSSLVRSDAATRTIVFVRTKHGADRIVEKLLRVGVKAEAIHGNKTQNARQKALDNFRRGRASVLVATDVAARGIDVDDISHVVNYDLPTEAETYVHRIGRTARGGASGIAITLCDHDERKYLKQIEKLLGKTLPNIKIEITPEPEPVPVDQSPDESFSPRGQRPGRRERTEGQDSRPAGPRQRRREQTRRSREAEETRVIAEILGVSTDEVLPAPSETRAPRTPRKGGRPQRPTGGPRRPFRSAGSQSSGSTEGSAAAGEGHGSAEQSVARAPRTNGAGTGHFAGGKPPHAQGGRKRPAGPGGPANPSRFGNNRRSRGRTTGR